MTSSQRSTEPATPAGAAGSVASADGEPSIRLRLDVAYDGTDFSGWASQPDRRTVCAVLETTLRMILREPVRLTVAGRTDAGVHASGQVAHLDLSAARYEQHAALLMKRLSGLLPEDLRVKAVSVAPPDFDARFSALSRTYQYRVSDQPWGVDPLHRTATVAWPWPLDVDLLNDASRGLLGLHDFAAYCRSREGATTIRTLQRLDWTRDGEQVVATVRADAFCHSMVRSVVGALLAVGGGRRDSAWPSGLLGQNTRSSAVAVAPAKGLTLVAVEYPDDDRLAERNLITRNRRT